MKKKNQIHLKYFHSPSHAKRHRFSKRRNKKLKGARQNKTLHLPKPWKSEPRVPVAVRLHSGQVAPCISCPGVATRRSALPVVARSCRKQWVSKEEKQSISVFLWSMAEIEDKKERNGDNGWAGKVRVFPRSFLHK